MKYRCPKCKHEKPAEDFGFRADGRRNPYCRPCNKADCAERRAKAAAVPPPPLEVRTLNSLLRDMPGDRGPLLGIVDARRFAP